METERNLPQNSGQKVAQSQVAPASWDEQYQDMENSATLDKSEWVVADDAENETLLDYAPLKEQSRWEQWKARIQGWKQKFECQEAWPPQKIHRDRIARAFRFVMIIPLIGFIFLMIHVQLDETTVNEDFTFSEGELYIEVSACRIWFKKGTETDVTAHVNSQISTGVSNSTEPASEYFETTDNKLKMKNPNDDENAWDIELESSSFPDIYINCTAFTCPIIQEEDENDLNFAGKLNIVHSEEASGNVYFKRIEVGEIMMNITGTLSIEQLTSDLGGTIWTKDGDVWIQSQQESAVSWKTVASSAYQFVGPKAYHQEEPTCDTQNITMSNSTFEVNNCEGNSVVCLTEGCAGEFSLDLTAVDGGVYVQLLKEPGKLYSTESVSWRDDKSLISHNVDLLSKVKIKEVRDEISGEVVKDQFFTLPMAGVNYDIGKWLFVTREAYTQLKPWWMQLFSFGLLLPVPATQDIRLVPWPRIYSKAFDDDDLTVMGPIWNDIFSEFGADPDQFLMWMSKSDSSDDWYKFSQNQFSEFHRELQSLNDNLPLVIAIIMSFFLALAGAIGGAVVVYRYLKRYSKMLQKDLDHKKRFKKIQLKQPNVREQFKTSLGESNLKNIEKDMKVEILADDGKTNFPPPFALTDLLMKNYLESMKDSLKAFLQEVMVEVEDDITTSAPVYRVREMKERYEAFCFERDYEMSDIKVQKDIFLKYGYELRTKSDSTTEAFQFIKRKTHEEQRDEDVKRYPGEDTFKFFIRKFYTNSSFEADIVFIEDLKLHYDNFCKRSKFNVKAACTKRVMETLGFVYQRLTVYIVKRMKGQQQRKFIIDYTKADMLMYYPDDEPMYTGWIPYNIMAVMAHLILIAILLLPLAIMIMAWQNYHFILSARPVDQFIVYQDWRYRPWMIPDKMENLTGLAIFILCLDGVVFILALVELLSYYYTREIPFSTDKILIRTKCHDITQRIFYCLILFIASIGVGYIMLGTCWCILGAVLNPEVFLPYAAAAATGYSFAILKVRGAIQNWKAIFTEITTIMKQRLEQQLTSQIDKVVARTRAAASSTLAQIGTSVDEIGQQVQEVQSQVQNGTSIGAALASGRYMYALQQTGLAENLENLDLDPTMVIAIASGDPAAVGMIAEKFEIDPVIVEALTAAVTQDLEAVKKCIPKLATIPGIDIDEKVAETIIMLAWNTQEINPRTAVKTAVVEFTRVMNKRLEQGTPFDQLDQTDADPIVAGPVSTVPGALAQQGVEQININPRVIEALVDMSSGKLTPLCDILAEFEQNEYLPAPTGQLFQFLKCINSHSYEFVNTLVQLIAELYPNIDLSFTQGLGCLVSQNYQKKLMRFSQQVATDNVEMWPEIDALLEILGISDMKTLVKVIMCITRDSQQKIQTLIPQLVELLNVQLNWNLDIQGVDALAQRIKSIYTMIYGVKLDVNKLEGHHDVDNNAIEFFPAMMLLPFELETRGKGQPTNVEEQQGWDEPEQDQDETPPQEAYEGQDRKEGQDYKAETPPPPQETYEAQDRQQEPDYKDIPPPPSSQLGDEEEKHPSSVGVEIDSTNQGPGETPLPAMRSAPPDPNFYVQESGSDCDEEIEKITHSIGEPEDYEELMDTIGPPRKPKPKPQADPMKLLVQTHQQASVNIVSDKLTPRRLQWLAERFNLSADIVMGLYVTITRADRSHELITRRLIRDVLGRIGVSTTNEVDFGFYQALYNLVVCPDQEIMTDAFEKLTFKKDFLDLAFVAKRVKSPKDIPLEFFRQYLELGEEDQLVKLSRTLEWASNSKKCQQWCQALAIRLSNIASNMPDLPEQRDRAEGRATGATKKQLSIARSLIQMESKTPTLLIKLILKARCKATDVQIANFTQLIDAHYIKVMRQGRAKETLLRDLSRLFQISQVRLENFIKIVLSSNESERKQHIISLLVSCGKDKTQILNVQRAIEDARNQLLVIKQNVEAFEPMADLLGLPATFIQSLSADFIEEMNISSEDLRRQFYIQFAKEFGVEDEDLCNAISNFVMGFSEDCDAFANALQIDPSILERACDLYDVSRHDWCLIQLQDILTKPNREETEADLNMKNNAAAFSAFIATYRDPIRKKKGYARGGGESFFASNKLSELFGISRDIFEGILNSIGRKENPTLPRYERKLQESILNLCKKGYGKFIMDDAFCQGFLSISIGGVDGIEDICKKAEYDPDFAEIFVTLSQRKELTHSQLLQDSNFELLCKKLNLNLRQMAAILALTQQDIEATEAICLALGPEFPPDIIRALMTVYKYSMFDRKVHASYDPKYKRTQLIQNIKPLAKLVEINDLEAATFVIALAQGNTGVLLDRIVSKFGWESRAKGIYAAFCCIFHQYPFKNDDRDTSAFDWVEDKEARGICAQLGVLLNLDPDGIHKIITCAREDPSTLQWLKHHLGFETLTAAKNFVKCVIEEGFQLPSDDEVPEDEEVIKLEGDLEMEWAEVFADDEDEELPSQPTQEASVQQEVDPQQKEAGENEMKKIIESNDVKIEAKRDMDTNLQVLVDKLNAGRIKGDEKEFTVQKVKTLMLVAAGKLNFQVLEDLQDIVLGESDHIEINPYTVGMLLAIMSGDLEILRKIAGVTQEIAEEEGEFGQLAKASIFTKLQLDIDQIEFLIKLANRDPTWLDTTYNNEQKIKAIMPNRKLARGVFGLCSLEPQNVSKYVKNLTQHLGIIEVDMAEILILLSNQALDKAEFGIAPLARKIEMESQMTNAFCCMAYNDLQLRMDAIRWLCERLNIKSVESCEAILTIIAGDFYVGWSWLTKLIYPSKDTPAVNATASTGFFGFGSKPAEEEPQNEDKCLHFQYLLQILAKQWDINESNLANDGPLGQDEQAFSDAPPLPSNTLGTNAVDAKQKAAFLKERNMVFGKEQIAARASLAEKLKLNPKVVDYIIGISQNNHRIFEATMKNLVRVPQAKLTILEALVNLYNGNDSSLPTDVQSIENYLETTFGEDSPIPHGLLRALFSSLRGFKGELCKGITQGFKNKNNTWNPDLTVSLQTTVPLCFAFIHSPDSLTAHLAELGDEAAEEGTKYVFAKLLDVQQAPDSTLSIMKHLISFDIKEFMELCLNAFLNIDPNMKQLIQEIHFLADPTSDIEPESQLTNITQKITNAFSLPADLTKAMILVISNRHHDTTFVDEKQTQMDSQLRSLILAFVNLLATRKDPPNDLTNKLMKPVGTEEPLIMKILDACYLAFKDSSGNHDQILETLPIVARVMLGDRIPQKAINLITGIINLFKCSYDGERKDQAIADLAKCFDIDGDLVKGLIATAKGDWQLMGDIISRVCDVDTSRLDQIQQLTLQLRAAKEADTEIEQTAIITDRLQQVWGRVGDGTDAEAVFDLLGPDGSDQLDFQQFQEAFKYYNLPMSQQRLLELFTRYKSPDALPGGESLMNLQSFVQSVARVKDLVSKQTMDSLGFRLGNQIRLILMAILILLILFAFIFVGIAGFTTNSTLGSVVNSIMPISAGALVSRASSTDMASLIRGIKDKVLDRIRVFTTTNDV